MPVTRARARFPGRVRSGRPLRSGARSGIARWPKVRVRKLGYVAHGDAVRILSAATALLLLIKDIQRPDLVVTIPGKLFEYLASNRPILMIGPPGDAADMVQSSGGVATGEADGEGIVAGLQTVIARPGPGDGGRSGAALRASQPRQEARSRSRGCGLKPSRLM